MHRLWKVNEKIVKTYAKQGYRWSSDTGNDRLKYCLELVRQKDYENYLCTLLLPKDARSGAIGVQGFNVEIAQIQDSVSDFHIGQLRIQFWREALDNIYLKNPPSHPVAQSLTWAVHNHKLTKRWLQRLLDARERRLKGLPFASITDVEEYGEHSVSSVLYLILETLGVRDVNADHAASHLGKVAGLTTLIRGVPYNLQHRKVHLPTEVMIEHDVSQEDVIRRGNSKELAEVVYSLASAAHSHLEKAIRLLEGVPSRALPAFLPTIPLRSYLDRLQRTDFNVFDPHLQQRDWRLPMKLLTASLLRKF